MKEKTTEYKGLNIVRYPDVNQEDSYVCFIAFSFTSKFVSFVQVVKQKTRSIGSCNTRQFDYDSSGILLASNLSLYWFLYWNYCKLFTVLQFSRYFWYLLVSIVIGEMCHCMMVPTRSGLVLRIRERKALLSLLKNKNKTL